MFYRAAGILRATCSTKLNTGADETTLYAARPQSDLKFIRSISARSADRVVYAPYACLGRYLVAKCRAKENGEVKFYANLSI